MEVSSRRASDWAKNKPISVDLFGFIHLWHTRFLISYGDFQRFQASELSLDHIGKKIRSKVAQIIPSNHFAIDYNFHRLKGYDISIVNFCSKVRLRGPNRHGFISNGFLEVKYEGLWRHVCADGWHRNASFVACGHLGYPDVDMEESNATPLQQPPHVSDYWMNQVRKNGSVWGQSIFI